MARDCSTTNNDSGADVGPLARRSYLKLTGATAVAAAGTSMVSTVAAAKEYETITVPANTARQFTVGSGETFENKLIDISAPGADVRIVASGSDWTIRNVGFTGEADTSGPHSPGKNLGGYPNLITASGTGTIEHVYLGDGVSGDMVRKGAIGIPMSFAGHIDISEVTMNGWTGNAIYAGGAAKSGGGGGTLAFDRCLLKNNNISHLRVATDGTTVKNTVIYNTNDVPLHPINGGVVNSRGVYDGYGTTSDVVTFENCDIDCTEADTNGAASALVAAHTTFEVKNSQVKGGLIGNVETTNVGSNPSHEAPDGAPTTATEAASGAASSSGSSATSGNSGTEQKKAKQQKKAEKAKKTTKPKKAKKKKPKKQKKQKKQKKAKAKRAKKQTKPKRPSDPKMANESVAAAPGSTDYCFTYNGRRYCFDLGQLLRSLTGVR
ncbi:hypothetical protein [Haladaptatus sp. CMAA 1911]|uniref:hypothetical protein n=1 Tax=unclassified Haladaptatus TaxID=2622732 RepID=UPI0037544745